ncbi:MAG: RNA 2',3'-cyclic phosphodiesterase [Ignavibacteriaceae bacterium]|jgi:2'-5' RNA ligase
MELENNKITRRLFIALEVPDDVKTKLLELKKMVQLKNHYPWEAKDKLHITLCFLGEVDGDQIPSIENLMERLAKHKKIGCKIPKFSFFGRPGNPNILYAAVKTDKKHMLLLRRLYKGLKELNIDTGAPRYKQHITLLRIKEKLEEGFVEAFSNFQFENISFIASEMVLYESTLLQTGSIYKQLKTIYLS